MLVLVGFYSLLGCPVVFMFFYGAGYNRESDLAEEATILKEV